MEIVIEAARGDGWMGDIAIDDVKLEFAECRKQFGFSDAGVPNLGYMCS